MTNERILFLFFVKGGAGVFLRDLRADRGFVACSSGRVAQSLLLLRRRSARASSHECARHEGSDVDPQISSCRGSRGAQLRGGSSLAALTTITELRTLGCTIEAVLGSAKRWDVYDGVQLQPFFVRAFAALIPCGHGLCQCQETYRRPRAG